MKVHRFCIILIVAGLVAMCGREDVWYSPSGTVPSTFDEFGESEKLPFDERAIVMVAVPRGSRDTFGNGFVFGDGSLVATARHLICNADLKSGSHKMFYQPLVVSSYWGDVFEAKIVATDFPADVAILDVSWPGHPALRLASEKELMGSVHVIGAGLIRSPELSTERLEVEVSSAESAPPWLLTGEAKRMGKGWSGSPIILAENGRAAGVFHSLGSEREARATAAWHIAFLVKTLKRSPSSALRPEDPQRPIRVADAEKAFDLAARCFYAYCNKNYTTSFATAWEFLRLRPDSPMAHALCALTSHCMGNGELAEEEIQQALQREPDSPYLHYVSGVILEEAGRNEKALDEYRKAADLGSCAGWVNLLNLLTVLDKLEEAEEIGRQAVEELPQNAYLWGQLGGILFLQENADEAVRASTRAVELMPLHGPLRGQLAHQLESAGRLDEAEEQFRKLTGIENENPVVWMWLAEFLLKHRSNQQDEILQLLNTVESLNDPEKISPEAIEEVRLQLKTHSL